MSHEEPPMYASHIVVQTRTNLAALFHLPQPFTSPDSIHPQKESLSQNTRALARALDVLGEGFACSGCPGFVVKNKASNLFAPSIRKRSICATQLLCDHTVALWDVVDRSFEIRRIRCQPNGKLRHPLPSYPSSKIDTVGERKSRSESTYRLIVRSLA